MKSGTDHNKFIFKIPYSLEFLSLNFFYKKKNNNFHTPLKKIRGRGNDLLNIFLKWKGNLSDLFPKCFYYNSEQIDTKISNIECSIVNLWSFKDQNWTKIANFAKLCVTLTSIL